MAPRKNKGTLEVDPAQLDTYFKKRMYEIGIVDTAEHFFKVEVDFPGTAYKQPIFAEDVKGNVEINYPSLYGGPELIGDSEKAFTRLRLHPDNQPAVDVKYFQEKGTGVHIFFPPTLIEKFTAKKKIDTLFLVEGEFKAYAGSLHDLDICGLGGKDLFTDEEKDLHKDILKIIDTCNVKNLVLLLDADVLHLNWDPEEDPQKDLAKRQYSFFNTVKRFRELAKAKVKDCYFSHIKSDYLNEAKGLDDLILLKGKKHAPKVIEDLKKLSASRVYFATKNLSAESVEKLKQYFNLKFYKGIPNAFYAWNEDLIKEKEFTFLGARFQNVKGEGLQLVKHADSFKFIRVGCDYFKLIRVPNSKKVLEQRRIAWKVGEIQRDYVAKGNANFFDTIEKYDAFCNVPDNTETYDATPENCFNLYYQLEHTPEDGPWPNIQRYLKHVFGTKPIGDGSTTNYDLALDHLQLKYLHPTQKLPIVCLVSRERATGKSTFLWLLREIFNENATVIGNQEINDIYNDDWASRAVIGIDEGFIDKKIILEKIKSQSTNDKIKLRGMYQGRQDVSFFGWFVLTSNDEDNFITIDNEEIRFWVNRVPPAKEEDPDLLQKMVEEIPQFLFFMKNRKIVHPKKTRFWFSKELLETDALRKIKETSKGWFAAELKEEMTDLFFHFKYHTLFYTLKELFGMLNKPNAPVRFREADIRRQLEDKFKLRAKLARYRQPNDPDDQGIAISATREKHGRCYEFRIENFLTEDEIRTELGDYMNYDDIINSRTTIVITQPELKPEEMEDSQKYKDGLPF